MYNAGIITGAPPPASRGAAYGSSVLAMWSGCVDTIANAYAKFGRTRADINFKERAFASGQPINLHRE